VLNTPAIPADTLSAGRPYKKAHAPRQRLAQAGAGSTRLRRASTVSSFARLLRVFDRLPTGSSSSSTHGPQGRPRMGDAVSALSRGLLIHKGNPPTTRWTPAESRVCRPRNSENTLRIPPPGKRPDAAPSAKPTGSRCLRPCKPVVLSAVSACRRFSRPTPPTTLDQPPNAFQAVCRFTENHFRGVPRRSAECQFCSGQGIRFAGYPNHRRSRHSAGESRILPRHPRSGLLPQSRRRDMTAANRSAK